MNAEVRLGRPIKIGTTFRMLIRITDTPAGTYTLSCKIRDKKRNVKAVPVLTPSTIVSTGLDQVNSILMVVDSTVTATFPITTELNRLYGDFKVMVNGQLFASPTFSFSTEYLQS
jgi:hypothetical protein